MNRVSGGGVALEKLVMQLSETEASLGPAWEKNFTQLQNGQQVDFSPFLRIEIPITNLITDGRAAGAQDLANSVEAVWKMYTAIIPLIVNLSKAENTLRGCWNQTFERLRFGKQCNFSPISTFTPPIPTLIQQGKEAMSSLQSQTGRSFKGIQTLIDSVTALWDSFAEARGWDKIALVPTMLPTPFFPISPSSPHGPSSPTNSSGVKNQGSSSSSLYGPSTPTNPSKVKTQSSSSSSSSTPTTPRSSTHYHDPLLPLQIDSDSDDNDSNDDWIVTE